ncbi:MAG: S1C family serine protease [Bacillota bacterium]
MQDLNRVVGESPAPRKRERRDFWSYLVVGLVGAIIGGFLVLGIAPQILLHRAGLLNVGALPIGQNQDPGGESGTGSDGIVKVLQVVGDPWEVVAHAAEKVSPAVVAIVNKTTASDFFGRQYVTDTSGSGLIITEDGYIVTNHHVVENSRGIWVSLADGRTLPAEIVGSDKATDLAVIKVDAENLPTGSFGDSDKLRPGELAIAIGNPLGVEFNRAVTAGVVSGLNRVLSTGEFSMRLIQTDAVINPGNSGGPLVNANGEVIGLNSAKIARTAVEGMGFAIPSNQVKRIAQEIMETGRVRRAQVGVRLLDKETANIYASDIKIENGLYVYEAIPGLPAAKAGLRSGDFILRVDGTVTNTFSTFQAILSEKSPGDTIVLTVLRGNTEIEIPVVLAEAQT